MTLTDVPDILGFRQDRVGARITGIVSLLRLEDAFGASTRFAWLADPDGAWPELADPGAFFTPGFVARQISVVSRKPDLTGRASIHVESARLNRANFAATLAAGTRYFSDAAFAVTTFQGEPRDDVAAEIRAAVERLELAPHLARALDRMHEAITAIGGGPASAIHVRRGDILDSFPWSYSAWPGKFAPDEYLRAFVGMQRGAVIAFSDTPAAVTHLAKGNDQIVPVDRLLAEHAPDVPPGSAIRDVLELMLMSRCEEVGAASSSAFSRAAQVIGGVRVVTLAAGLPRPVAAQAHDALLDRVIARPESFFAPGDLAQCVAYAAPHACKTGRAADLVAAFADRSDLMQRFPFVPRHLANAAETAGLHEAGYDLARFALAQKMLRPRDRFYCESLVLLHDVRRWAAGQTTGASEARLHAQFVGQVFGGKSGDETAAQTMADLILSRDGIAARNLMFSARLGELLALRPDAVSGRLPHWMFLTDWDELLKDDPARASLRRWPDLNQKLGDAKVPLDIIETAMAEGVDLPRPDEDVALLLGFAASVLTLHGRLKRVFRLLEWLDRAVPNQAITSKRLSDASFQAGNRRMGWRHLDRAIELSPGNALLNLSAAIRAKEDGYSRRRMTHLRDAVEAWPDLTRAAHALDRARKDEAHEAKAAAKAAAKSSGKAKSAESLNTATPAPGQDPSASG